MNTFSFSIAIEFLKYGEKLSRLGWNGKDQYIELGKNITCVNCNNEKIYSNNAIIFHGTSGCQIGWLASQGDMLANDWYIYLG